MAEPMLQRSRSPIEAHYRLFDTPIGWCGVAWSDLGLIRLQLPESDRAATERRASRNAARASDRAPAAIAQLIADLQRYFFGGRVDFLRLRSTLPKRRCFTARYMRPRARFPGVKP
jgi:methylated-DNA-[protein]-cysteine S-methyltransferase